MPELKFDPHNYRIHTDKNKRLIRKSLEDCGAGRSILFDKDDCIIAGNSVYEQAQELRLKVRVIESDGKELIAIKRTDLSTEDQRRKALALADNYTTDTSVFDVEAILEDFSPEDLDLWEFSVDLNTDNIESDKSSIENQYSKKIDAPIYKPTMKEAPMIEELFDKEKYLTLCRRIDEYDLSDDEKHFLTLAASRHIVFDYANIAEYYAHSRKEIQSLMEDSALVIIDFNKAINDGYVRLSQEIAEQYSEEHGN